MAVDLSAQPKHDASLDAAMQSRGTRRLFFGTNVLLAIVLAFTLLVIVNWVGQDKSYRKDLSSLGAYSLSERSKNVLGEVGGEVRLTSIYTSEEPEKHHDKYLPRVRDLFAEYSRNGDVIVENITEDSEKRQLAKRLEKAYSKQATAHREAIDQAKETYANLKTWAEQEAQTFGSIEVNNGWLAKFTSFTNALLNLRDLPKAIDKTVDGVNKLTTGDLPKYAEANAAIKETDDKVLSVAIENTGKFLENMGGLVRSVQSGEESFFAETPAKLDELRTLSNEMMTTLGSVDGPMPEDPKPALQEGAQVLGKLSNWLAAEVARITEFTERHPIIAQHPQWRFKQQVSIFVTETTLPQMLGDTQKKVAGVRAEIRQILAGNLDTRRLQNALEEVRKIAADFDKTFATAAQRLRMLQDDFNNVDPASLALLSEDYYQQRFQPELDALKKLNETIDALPELEIGELGDALKQENAVVVEAGGKAKVVAFDQMWPVGESARAIGDTKRVFNGDTAVSQALISLTNDKPFAQIVITHFETDVQEERFRRIAGTHRGDIPAMMMDGLRARLTDMNFEVVNWNIGRGEARPEAPEGVPQILFIMPPPDPRAVTPGLQNMYKTWTPQDEQTIRDAIGKDGKAIFLTTYSVPRPLNPLQPPPPFVQYPYALRDYLLNTWGIDVDVNHRITLGVNDPKDPNRFGINLETWPYPSFNNFTDHPIGKSLRARRVPMLNVNPVSVAAKVPDGVQAEEVLAVQSKDRFIAIQDVYRVLSTLSDTTSEGWINKDLEGSDGWVDRLPPFGAIVAAKNAEGGKVVVFGSGASFVTDYLMQPILRQENGRVTFDPPPTANIDLMVNALYWLLGKESLIGSGPVVAAAIEPVSEPTRRWLGAGVTAWALLALCAGATVLFVRRK